MSEIKQGAIVALKGNDINGPRMAVGDITEAGANCFWFVGKDLKSATIPIDALKFVNWDGE